MLNYRATKNLFGNLVPVDEPLSLPIPLILTLLPKSFDVTFKEFYRNEIMQKNVTGWKVKLALKLFFLEKEM